MEIVFSGGVTFSFCLPALSRVCTVGIFISWTGRMKVIINAVTGVRVIAPLSSQRNSLPTLRSSALRGRAGILSTDCQEPRDLEYCWLRVGWRWAFWLRFYSALHMWLVRKVLFLPCKTHEVFQVRSLLKPKLPPATEGFAAQYCTQGAG